MARSQKGDEAILGAARVACIASQKPRRTSASSLDALARDGADFEIVQSMMPKSGYRFSENIMLQQ
jgi:hypothetical protein